MLENVTPWGGRVPKRRTMNHCSFSAHACIGAQRRLFFIKNFLKLPSVSSIIIYCSPGGQKLCLLIYVFYRSLTLKLKLIVCWEEVKNLSQKPLNFLYKNSFLSLSSSPTTHTHSVPPFRPVYPSIPITFISPVLLSISLQISSLRSLVSKLLWKNSRLLSWV